MALAIALFTVLLVGLGFSLLLLFAVRLEREGVRMERAEAERSVRRELDEE